jgi:RNA polymerase-binding transcription factor DksA
VHYHYLTIEQRETLEKLIRSRIGGGTQLATALERLHQPDYGVCIECGKDIGFVRLEADPWALHCQACGRLPVSPRP